MTARVKLCVALAAGLGASCAAPSHAGAATFDWQRFKGRTLTFLANNNPLGQALVARKKEFEALTGMTLKVDAYQEQQMRQRLVTVMNARSDEVDVFMTLPSREGAQFAASNWYADLTDRARNDVAPDYDATGLNRTLIKAATFGGKLTSMPLNIEGPILYYRTDILKKCGLRPPESIRALQEVAERIKGCDHSITPFVARGLKPAVAYSFSNVLHNVGGRYLVNGKSALCSREGKEALAIYSDLLRDSGPPGVVNYNFYQTSALYRAGRAAMAYESSNELHSMMEGGARLKDTAMMPLPAGEAGSVPTVIGWGMAVSAYSQQPDASWYFVQWASSPTVQRELAMQGIAAPNPAATEDAAVRRWRDEEPVRGEWQAAVDAVAAHGSSEVGYPIVANAESREFIGQAVQDLVLKQKTVDQACADADAALDRLIARE